MEVVLKPGGPPPAFRDFHASNSGEVLPNTSFRPLEMG